MYKIQVIESCGPGDTKARCDNYDVAKNIAEELAYDYYHGVCIYDTGTDLYDCGDGEWSTVDECWSTDL